MFESIVSRVANAVRTSIRALGAATRKTPWVVPAAILVLFLVL